LQCLSEQYAIKGVFGTQLGLREIGARLIGLFGEQTLEHERFTASENVRRAILRRERMSGIQGPVLEGLRGILFLVVLMIAVLSRICLPVLVAFLVLINRLQPHLRVLEQSGATFASTAGQFDEVEWLLEPSGKPASPDGNLAFTGFREGIEFDNITFDYGSRGDPALYRASFVLRRRRSTVLIGSSGAGKSTTVNLLYRLLEPASGMIKVDWQLLANQSLRLVKPHRDCGAGYRSDRWYHAENICMRRRNRPGDYGTCGSLRAGRLHL
jgi:ABC-type multidrug transport system fused ATPase/permease subunit